MMQACGEEGPKSVADNFASLEASRAALPAENDEIKAVMRMISTAAATTRAKDGAIN
ncbi:hypothetical protein U3A98_001486 [Cronobacter turicensis]|nr:hypothetical protein [Cronobacter turicensis]